MRDKPTRLLAWAASLTCFACALASCGQSQPAVGVDDPAVKNAAKEVLTSENPEVCNRRASEDFFDDAYRGIPAELVMERCREEIGAASGARYTTTAVSQVSTSTEERSAVVAVEAVGGSLGRQELELGMSLDDAGRWRVDEISGFDPPQALRSKAVSDLRRQFSRGTQFSPRVISCAVDKAASKATLATIPTLSGGELDANVFVRSVNACS